MHRDNERLAALVMGMRAAYASGANAMAFAREHSQTQRASQSEIPSRGETRNETIATLIAYDLQSGSYVDFARTNANLNQAWCAQIAQTILPLARRGASVLEVGCGEATTLTGVLHGLESIAPAGYGFDVSWSRISVAKQWLAHRERSASLFVADLFAMPLATDSIDIVYTSHSLEPNGGREEESIRELLRVARDYVVLIEPAYELGNDASRARMDQHGYVKGLREAAEACGAAVLDHRLLAVTPNPLNPSGVLVLQKHAAHAAYAAHATTDAAQPADAMWSCPITRTKLIDCGDAFVAVDAGLVYPVLRGIPLLRPEHAVVASLFGTSR